VENGRVRFGTLIFGTFLKMSLFPARSPAHCSLLGCLLLAFPLLLDTIIPKNAPSSFFLSALRFLLTGCAYSHGFLEGVRVILSLSLSLSLLLVSPPAPPRLSSCSGCDSALGCSPYNKLGRERAETMARRWSFSMTMPRQSIGGRGVGGGAQPVIADMDSPPSSLRRRRAHHHHHHHHHHCPCALAGLLYGCCSAIILALQV